MKLKIEAGQLLKPCSLPWSPDGWVIPPGWTPDRTPEMTVRFEALCDEWFAVGDMIVWQKIEADEGERLQSRRKPWPGWVMLPGPHDPRATKTDRRISKAYLRLHGELGAWPPDGRYEFRGGKMDIVELDIPLGNRSPLVLLTDDWGIKSDDVRARIEELRDQGEHEKEEPELCGCGNPADVLGTCYDCAFDEGHYEAYGSIE